MPDDGQRQHAEAERAGLLRAGRRRLLRRACTAARKRQEARVHAGSYGLTPAAGQPPPAGPGRSGAWPVRSGLVPPLAEGFIARTETVPGLEAALVPGAAVALVPGTAAGGVRDRPGSCGKTQLAAYLAGSLWRSRDGGPAGLGGRDEPGIGAVRLRAGRREAGPGSRAVMPRRWRPGSWPGWRGPAGRGWWCSMTCTMRRTWTG